MKTNPSQNSALLQQVNKFLEEAVIWQPLTSKSTSNKLYRGTSLAHKKVGVLRINSDDNLGFGVNRQQEARILEIIQPYFWAPKVIHNAVNKGWCLFEDHGPDGRAKGLSTPVQEALVTSIGEWHSIPVDSLKKAGVIALDYHELMNRYQEATEDRPAHQRAETQSHIDAFLTALDALPKIPLTLTHHDLHLGNVCVNERITVVDWEYAALGNPWVDLAAIHKQFQLGVDTVTTINAFQKLTDDQITSGLQLAHKATVALDQLWSQNQGNLM